MFPFDTSFAKTTRNKKNKSLGNRLVEDKIRYYKLQQKKSQKFNSVLKKLNQTLRKSESLLQINHYPLKNDIENVLPKEQINHLRKIEYYKKWHFNNNILPIIGIKNSNSQKNININKNKKETEDNKSEMIHKNNFAYLGSLYKANKNSKLRNNYNNKKIEEEEDNIPFYFKGLEPRKSNIKASEIVKLSIQELNKRNTFKRYRYNMEEKVGYFVDYNDKYSNYYDFDKKVKINIKDERTGISMPGNVLNRTTLGYIRTLQPKHINLRVKKSIVVPEKTLLPVPQGLGGKGLKYTHITFKDVYNDKNKLI